MLLQTIHDLGKRFSSPAGIAALLSLFLFLGLFIPYLWLDSGSLSNTDPKMLLRYILGLVILVLVAVLLGLIVFRQILLQEKVRRRTASLLEANRKLRQEVQERRQAQSELESSKKKYFTLFNNANDVVVLCQRNEDTGSYHLVEVNEAVSWMGGCSREQLISRNLFDGVTPGSLCKVPEILDEIEKTGHTTVELDYLNRDGSILSLEMNAIRFELEGKTVLMAIGRNITARKKAEYALRESLAEKEVLLREVHHRVKNNLQVIMSLLDLESSNIQDPAALEHFRECQNRIQSMALVHQNLYQSRNFSTIHADKYIRMLVDHLIESCRPFEGISVQYELDEVGMDLDTAVPCGFVINELVTNACRHAFSGKSEGTIRVSLKRTPSRTLTLAISDNGTGFPESIDFRQTPTLGLQIVTALSRQLEADVSMERENGTRFVIRFSATREKIGV